jgi:hypothetical protein
MAKDDSGFGNDYDTERATLAMLVSPIMLSRFWDDDEEDGCVQGDGRKAKLPRAGLRSVSNFDKLSGVMMGYFETQPFFGDKDTTVWEVIQVGWTPQQWSNFVEDCLGGLLAEVYDKSMAMFNSRLSRHERN